MPTLTNRPIAGQTVFRLPIHDKTATATVNSVNASIASQDDDKITLASAVASTDIVAITYTPVSANPTYSKVADIAAHPGEDGASDRTWGGSKWSFSVKSASGSVKSTSAVYAGVIVTAAIATADINIRDGGVAGTIIDVIKSGTAVGPRSIPPVACTTSLYVEFVSGATGTVTVLYV